MKRTFLLLFLAGLGYFNLAAQTLFTYGKYSVDAKEFLRAFNKNNTPQPGARATAIRDYLPLYINSRLKIREAYDRRYDTLPQVKMEVENLRKQISENFMNDPQVTPRLQKEAFERSLKDIHVAHIFISFTKKDEPDTANARIKKDELLTRLKKGEDFGQLANRFSDDTLSARHNGDIGYITVFTLPYEFENAVYATPVGKYSALLTSKSGYHIFKNLGERKALGRMKAKQILLAIPPGSDDITRKQLAGLADSIYNALKKGADFAGLAGKYSNDYISSANGGTMPEISVGEFDPTFENYLWSLEKDGELGKPLQTSHGWHIIKRISVTPVVTDSANITNKQALLNRIMYDSRWKSSRDFIYKKVMERPGVKRSVYDEKSLWATADSLILLTPVKAPQKMLDLMSPLFKLGDSTYTVINFINYATHNRFNANGSIKPYPQVMDEYTRSISMRYYQDNLESYNEEFRNQMQEFRDGNIFFEIMQEQVWNKAQNDTAALKDLYEKNKARYTWKKSADAVIFYCADEATASLIYPGVKKDPASWKKIAEQYAEKVVADSSRFEWEQLPPNASANPKAGTVYEPVVNTSDNSASFAYVLKITTDPSQRSFADARGLVINDYQELLEKKWTESLRKKYPVKINEKVLQDISR